MKLKIQNSKLKMAAAACLFLLAGAAMADLEWINGGVPKNTPEKTGSTVKDAPPVDNPVPAGGDQDIIVSHLTTCTKILNQYPVDSVNFFYQNKNTQVSYFAYFLIKPSSRIHTATVEWYSPSNLKIAKYDQEFRVGFVDRLLTIQNETYQWFMVNATIGLDHLHPEYGQTGMPRDVGLYTVHLTVDGQLVGITFFYIKPEETKAPPAIATVVPRTSQPLSMPMSTPVFHAPILPVPNSIQ